MSELTSGPEPVQPQGGPQPQGELYFAPQPGYAAPMAPAAPPRGSATRLVAGVVAAIVLATGGGIGIGWNLARLVTGHAPAAAQIHTVAPVSPSANANSQTAIAKVMPAVVDVNTVIQTIGGTAQAAGTGLILDSTGDVLTNNHVVEGAISIKVTVQGRGTFTADVVGVAPKQDIAVVHIPNISGLPTVEMADSSKLTVGDRVYAIGNALGLGGTPRTSEGQITALDQTITASEGGAHSETLTGMIEANAEISPGDSGGALVNTAGQVVGIITAGQATSFRTTTSNVAFAIQSNTAVDVANRILNGEAGNGILIGPVGFLGVSVQALDDATASRLGLSTTSGVLVLGVQPGSPAEGAGIVKGSVITAVNSTSTDSPEALGDALHQFKPGDKVKVTWITQGKSHSATVALMTGPAV